MTEADLIIYNKGVEEGKKHTYPSNLTIKFMDETKNEIINMKMDMKDIKNDVGNIKCDIAELKDLLKEFIGQNSKAHDSIIASRDKALGEIKCEVDKKADEWVETAMKRLNWLVISAVFLAILSLIIIERR